MALTVIKLGGSLAGGGALAAQAARLAGTPGVVLVPGGGPFADAVRAAEGPLALSARACHRMAILAMEQMAHAIADRVPDLSPCASLADMAALDAPAPPHGAGLWFPAHLLLAADDIAESWDVTSDSLACWLACRLKARALVLVKSPGALAGLDGVGTPQAVAEWARRGIVDAAFPGLSGGFGGEIRCIEAVEGASIRELISASPHTGAT